MGKSNCRLTHANADRGDRLTMQVEAYLSGNGFDQETYKGTRLSRIRKGIHEFDSPEGLDWVIPENCTFLVLSLSRSDGVILDRLVFPLGSQ